MACHVQLELGRQQLQHQEPASDIIVSSVSLAAKARHAEVRRGRRGGHPRQEVERDDLDPISRSHKNRDPADLCSMGAFAQACGAIPGVADMMAVSSAWDVWLL